MATTVFAAAGEVSPVLFLKAGQSATYGVTTTFAATVELQKQIEDGTWEPVRTITSTTLATVTIPALARDTRFRWACTAYTSGSPTVSLTPVLDVLSEVVNRDGAVVFRITGDGVEAPTVKALGAAATPLGSATVSTLLTVSGLLSLGAPQTPLTAHAGGTQAAALALSALVTVHEVTVCATNGDSVKLPAPGTVGEVHIVINNGAASLQVFGSGTDTINAVATGTGVAVATIKRAIFVALTTGTAARWAMILGA
jgi:hypothetical protein